MRQRQLPLSCFRIYNTSLMEPVLQAKLPQVIVIAGAPGTGKSTLARVLQERTQTPLFEFGWIPEFRHIPNGYISYEEEEQISFENLVLVTRNYLRHGFRGVILTDLNNRYVAEIGAVFSGLDYRIVTLVLQDEAVLAQRVLDPSRTSAYRDVEAALAINRSILSRPCYPYERRVDVTGKDVAAVLTEILEALTAEG